MAKKFMYTKNNEGGIDKVYRTCRNILFTHNDLDGAGCAVVFMLAFGDGEVYYCGNGEDIDGKVCELLDEVEHDIGEPITYNVYIADNSVSKQYAELIDIMYKDENVDFNIHLLDHHESAKWLAETYEWAKVDIAECGATLMEQCLVHNIPRTYATTVLHLFCMDVRDRDLWLWKENGNMMARYHNELMHIRGIENYAYLIANRIAHRVQPISNSDLDMVKDRLKIADDYVRAHQDNFAKATISFKGRIYTTAVTYADRYVSELGNAICENNNDIDICMIVCLSRGQYGSIELRTTKDDVDLSAIAKKMGGGGHKKAAGFPLTEECNANNEGNSKYYSPLLMQITELLRK